MESDFDELLKNHGCRDYLVVAVDRNGRGQISLKGNGLALYSLLLEATIQRPDLIDLFWAVLTENQSSGVDGHEHKVVTLH